MGAIQGFLSNYSVNFQLALFAWPFFSVMLTLPILAYLYHRDGKLNNLYQFGVHSDLIPNALQKSPIVIAMPVPVRIGMMNRSYATVTLC